MPSHHKRPVSWRCEHKSLEKHDIRWFYSCTYFYGLISSIITYMFLCGDFLLVIFLDWLLKRKFIFRNNKNSYDQHAPYSRKQLISFNDCFQHNTTPASSFSSAWVCSSRQLSSTSHQGNPLSRLLQRFSNWYVIEELWRAFFFMETGTLALCFWPSNFFFCCSIKKLTTYTPATAPEVWYFCNVYRCTGWPKKVYTCLIVRMIIN